MADIVCQCVIPVDHPAFAGHFPGRPILPGVLLLVEVAEALRANGQSGAGMTISSAKFLAPVRPGAVLTIRVQEAGASRRFEVLQGEQRVATGALGI
jgi:3-hydroxyacyl-[acyl-carrier-protein] dehydratase